MGPGWIGRLLLVASIGCAGLWDTGVQLTLERCEVTSCEQVRARSGYSKRRSVGSRHRAAGWRVDATCPGDQPAGGVVALGTHCPDEVWSSPLWLGLLSRGDALAAYPLWWAALVITVAAWWPLGLVNRYAADP